MDALLAAAVAHAMGAECVDQPALAGRHVDGLAVAGELTPGLVMTGMWIRKWVRQ